MQLKYQISSGENGMSDKYMGESRMKEGVDG